MLKQLLDRLKAGTANDALFQPRMPDVEQPPNPASLFDKARSAATGATPTAAGRHVVIVTPGRLLMFQPCPAAGSMPAAQVTSITQMIPPRAAP